MQILAEYQNNIPEYSVSEISNSLKSLIESNFQYVKIRGEISNLKFHQSGHVYFNLKDENAVLNAVCFKNIAGNLKVRPEEGLEITAIGRITTYGLRSNYQIIVNAMEIAGIGSLMEQLEKRKKDFIAKGYFNPDYKKSIPKYPKNLYVITSETGAVIQDIIHRIEARYPLNIFIVPVKVQGQGAEIEIANAISLVNEIKDQKADVIIIARGGGSIEDLWCFNEEIIVKAVFDSKIPIISAIGHETDTTLIDYAADLRAPTPTAAAELATPIAAEIKQCLINIEVRLTRFIQSKCNDEKERISIITRFLMQNDRILQEKYQKTDDLIDSLNFVIRSKFDKIKNKTENLCFNLKTPSQIFDLFSHKISNYFKFIQQNCANLIKNKENNLSYLTINQNILLQKLKFNKIKIDDLSQRIENAFNQKITYFHDRTANLDKFLSSLSYKNTLKRGFSIIRDDQNQIVKSAKNDFNNKELLIEFFDDKIKLNVSKKNN